MLSKQNKYQYLPIWNGWLKNPLALAEAAEEYVWGSCFFFTGDTPGFALHHP